jgi:UDPglucose--hexose-1-phosphate uridylyltransferase
VSSTAPVVPLLADLAGRRTAIRLADGRELIYFDDVPGLDRSAPDRRDLPLHQPRSEVRHDRVLDEWIIIAAHRQGRTNLPPPDQCPLCPGTELGEVPADDYHVVAFENRFPSLSGDLGRCEVVCFTSDHDASFTDLDPRRWRTLGQAWADRTVTLGGLESVEYVFVFENRGTEIGATLQHPHGQIYGYPFVPPKPAQELASARRFHDLCDGCLFCDVLTSEIKVGERVVAESTHAVAFVPEAPRWPFEVHVYLRRHVPDLAALTVAELDDVMALYADVLRRFDGLFGVRMPYVAAWHQAPVHTDRDIAHLHAEIFSPRRAPDKLKFLAASESSAGAFIVDVLPEQAAALLRNAL